MKEERIVRKLAAVARKEAPPEVDVADRVMAILRTAGRGRRTGVNPLVWVAVGSATLAIPVLAAAVFFGDSWGETLMATLTDLGWWML
jgi:hypothetical protein